MSVEKFFRDSSKQSVKVKLHDAGWMILVCGEMAELAEGAALEKR